jgi:hypothetical protein
MPEKKKRRQTMIYKTLHRKLMIAQRETSPPKKPPKPHPLIKKPNPTPQKKRNKTKKQTIICSSPTSTII